MWMAVAFPFRQLAMVTMTVWTSQMKMPIDAVSFEYAFRD